MQHDAAINGKVITDGEELKRNSLLIGSVGARIKKLTGRSVTMIVQGKNARLDYSIPYSQWNFFRRKKRKEMIEKLNAIKSDLKELLSQMPDKYRGEYFADVSSGRGWYWASSSWFDNLTKDGSIGPMNRPPDDF